MEIRIKRYWSTAYGAWHAWPLWSKETDSSGTVYRYLYWPVRLGWSTRHGNWRKWFRWHGWQMVGSTDGEIRFGWTYHFGPLKVKFGSLYA